MASHSKSSVIGIGFVLCSVILVFATYKFANFWMSTPQGGEPVQTIFYDVKPHQPPLAIAKDLEKLHVISDAKLFYWYGRLSGKSKKFKAGDYRFTTKMRPTDVMAIIMSGISYTTPVTVPEGYSMAQIAEVIEQFREGAGPRFLKLCSNAKLIHGLGFNPAPNNLEGYLFPDTYFFGRRTPEEEMIRQMVKKFRDVYTPAMAERAKAIGMTETEVVTLASIIEKETGAKEERPLISSIFHNRLKKKMRLQTDPTVIYGIKDYKGNISRKDLETYTPYNTYKINGLPPGPISNPGKESLVAALYPAESPYLFFVSHNDGTHEFTSTYEDHNRAVAKFQVDAKARDGKSWRDLNKRPVLQK